MTNSQKNIVALGIIDRLVNLAKLAIADDKLSKDTKEFIECELEAVEESFEGYRELIEQ